MGECIERDAAIEAAKHAWAKGLEPSQYLEILPAADVAQVVRGRWMKRRNGGTLCSRCGHYTQHKGNVLDMSEAIACPWCGAIMDGGDNTER